MAVIKRLSAVSRRFGGEEHTGWLPANAATPPPTPIEDAAAYSITGIDVAVVVPFATDDLVLGATIIGIVRVSTTPTVEDRVARAMLIKPR